MVFRRLGRFGMAGLRRADGWKWFGHGEFIIRSIEKILIIIELDICLNIFRGSNDEKSKILPNGLLGAPESNFF